MVQESIHGSGSSATFDQKVDQNQSPVPAGVPPGAPPPVVPTDHQQCLRFATNPGRHRARNAAAKIRPHFETRPGQKADGGWPISERRRAALFWRVCCLLAAGSGLLSRAASRREPPADITIINNAEPESLDPGHHFRPAGIAHCHRLVRGIDAAGPKDRAAGSRPGAKLGHFAGRQHLHVSFAHQSALVHRRANHGGRRGLFLVRALNPATASDYAGQLYYLKNGEAFNTGKIKDPALVGVHAPDKFTVRVELNHPTAFFLDLCALPVTVRCAAADHREIWRPLADGQTVAEQRAV